MDTLQSLCSSPACSLPCAGTLHRSSSPPGLLQVSDSSHF